MMNDDRDGADRFRTQKAEHVNDGVTGQPRSSREERVVQLAEERVRVHKRKRAKGKVRIRTVVREEPHVIEELLHATDLDVTRVPVERFVSGPVPDRQEGDTRIVSLHREVVVYERRLQVYAELHITRKTHTKPHRETVLLRREDAVVERLPPGSE